MTIDIEKLKTNYPQEIDKYKKLGEYLQLTFHRMLHKSKIHIITYREKELDSLVTKIVSKDKYETLDQITDLCGLRIITYLESDISYVEEILLHHFKIDEVNSHDHRIKKANDFGYMSLHLVLGLSEDRASLPENVEIKDLKAEVQIRSILQHAWAEIEHGLGYKSSENVPNNLKRGANRLSAILEAADLDFVRLKKIKDDHIAQAASVISSTVESRTPIDTLNISVLVDHNDALKDVRNMLAMKYGVTFVRRSEFTEILSKLDFFGIQYLETLEEKLNEDKTILIKFCDLLFARRTDNKRIILFEAPLEYYLHFLGSAADINYWEEYRSHNNFASKSSITEVTNFLQLHNDSLLK
jgi:putative GTP pyrophosphokinase